MSNNANIFTLRFFDNEVTPHSFNAKELGELVIQFYDGIKDLIDNRFPSINADDVFISLISIKNESESLVFESKGTDEIELVLKDLGIAITKGNPTDLPAKTYKSVKRIHSIAKAKNCCAELVQKGERLFIVEPSNEFIEQQRVLIKSKLVLYGDLIQLRGKAAKNRAWVELYDGSKIAFSITDEQLFDLKDKIKEPVALRGEAKWNTISKKVVSFKLHEILDYSPKSVIKGFNDIYKASSKYWDKLSGKDIINHLKGEA